MGSDGKGRTVSSGKERLVTMNDDSKQEGRIVVYVDEEIEDLVPEFLERRSQDVKTIRDALGPQDFETIRVLGHDMKGSGGGYGFDAITDLGARLEVAAKEGDAPDIGACTDELEQYLQRVEVIYE